ncbi:MAG: hypothetical protein ACLP7P_03715 [Rhodomicrobium sp.]
MRDDLLDAQAVIDWAISQCDVFEAEVNAWIDSHPRVIAEETNAHGGMKTFEVSVSDLPSLMDVQAGIIIHAFRSALDILAVALARRNGQTSVDHIHFPVSGSLDIFKTGGMKKVKGISTANIATIEGLNPYKGGNKLLFALHNMDLRRKHTRLIKVSGKPRLDAIAGWGEAPEVVSYKEGGNPKNKTFTLIMRGGDPNYKLYISPEITISETDLLPSQPAVALLRKFASLTETIVDLFDT